MSDEKEPPCEDWVEIIGAEALRQRSWMKEQRRGRFPEAEQERRRI